MGPFYLQPCDVLLYFNAANFKTAYIIIVQYNAVQYSAAVRYVLVQFSAVNFSLVQCSKIHFRTVPCRIFPCCGGLLRTVPHCGSNLSFKNIDKTDAEKTERKHEVKPKENSKREAGEETQW